MSHYKKHAPGAFAWIELGTNDQAAAKDFYGSLFGWAAVDSPMGPNEYYTEFKLEDANAGAAYTLRAEETAMGVPPHWNLYISVESADSMATRAAALGATVLAGPFDVATHGRMAVIRDPAGAIFSIWEPKTHHGLGIMNQHGSLCWADLNVPGATNALQFYCDLFGYTATAGDGGYLHIKNGGQLIGGMPPATSLPPYIPPHWMIYIQVDDCAASTARAQQLGAKVLMGPMAMPDVGTLTVLDDPQGAGFALFQPAPRSA